MSKAAIIRVLKEELPGRDYQLLLNSIHLYGGIDEVISALEVTRDILGITHKTLLQSLGMLEGMKEAKVL